jgi:hypothetical protein
MHAEIRTVKDPILRVKLWKKERLSTKTMLWIENYESQQQELRDKIVAAKLLPSVDMIML